MTAVLIVAGVIIAGVFTVSWLLSGLVIWPRTWDYDKCYEEEIRRGGLDRTVFETEFHGEEFYTPSPFGYQLHGMVIPKKEGVSFPDGRERVAVIAHGYSYTLFGSVKYASIFRELGFTCVLYDQRNHGKNDKRPTTMGYYEHQDLGAICQWARERYGENCVLGLHGESMGAATVMLYAPTDSKLAFVMEDCGYSDLREQLYYDMHHLYHLPKQPFLAVSSLLSKLRGGIWFRQVKPAEAVTRCPESLPMLFIHGLEDHFVPTYMVYNNYEAKKGEKRIHTVENTGHAQSWFHDPKAYSDMMEAFLKEYQII